MKIWDVVKKAWAEVKAEVDPLHFDIETGKRAISDDEEIRHEAVYDGTTGVESMQPVIRKRGEINE